MKVGYGSVAEDAVWAGVDTHAAANWLSVVDARGSELFSGGSPPTPRVTGGCATRSAGWAAPWPQAWSARAPMAQGS